MTTLEKLQAESRERQLEKFRKVQRVAPLLPSQAHKKTERVVILKPVPQVDMGKMKDFNKKTNPVDVEQVRGYTVSRKLADKVYPSAFSDKRDSTRPPAKYSNRKAVDDYNPF